MRWTNYFLHPADNRYYVFTFREEEHADSFELSLKKDGVPYERSEKEFGVPRTHFNEALRRVMGNQAPIIPCSREVG